MSMAYFEGLTIPQNQPWDEAFGLEVSLQVPFGWLAELQLPFSPGKYDILK